jgi:hypothetical protein
VIAINSGKQRTKKAARSRTMISNELRDFVDVVLEKRQITDEHVQQLAREILPDGAVSHEVVDVLVALDRAVAAPSSFWASYLVSTVVDYVVWVSRPTGVVTRDLAQWLIATLSVGEGPTDNAMRIAFEVAREAERCDEALIRFSMGRMGEETRRKLSATHMALLAS